MLQETRSRGGGKRTHLERRESNHAVSRTHLSPGDLWVCTEEEWTFIDVCWHLEDGGGGGNGEWKKRQKNDLQVIVLVFSCIFFLSFFLSSLDSCEVMLPAMDTESTFSHLKAINTRERRYCFLIRPFKMNEGDATFVNKRRTMGLFNWSLQGEMKGRVRDFILLQSGQSNEMLP